MFFSVMPTGPNPAQISIAVSQKSPTAGLLYNDFGQGRNVFSPNFVVANMTLSKIVGKKDYL